MAFAGEGRVLEFGLFTGIAIRAFASSLQLRPARCCQSSAGHSAANAHVSKNETWGTRRKGNAVADDEQLARIVKVPKREFMRRGINQHTLEKICKRKPVRAIKLAKCLKVLEEWER